MGGFKRKSQPSISIHLAAAGTAALVNYPLWRSSVIRQSGYLPSTASTLELYSHAFKPPYKGVVTVIGGMTWARAGIFFGSDKIKGFFEERGIKGGQVAAPLLSSSFVQIVNMPLIRTSIISQDPSSTSIRASVKRVVTEEGVLGLWRGTTAGMMKTVPKYCTAVVVKDYIQKRYNPKREGREVTEWEVYTFMVGKAVTAAVAGTVLTNPADIIRNEMFKPGTTLGVLGTIRQLREREGWRWMGRGVGSNLLSVSVPVGLTIFLIDALERRSVRGMSGQ